MSKRAWLQFSSIILLLVGLLMTAAAANFLLDRPVRETAGALGLPHVIGQTQAILISGLLLIVAAAIMHYRIIKSRRGAKR